jgi:hypothetical protein
MVLDCLFDYIIHQEAEYIFTRQTEGRRLLTRGMLAVKDDEENLSPAERFAALENAAMNPFDIIGYQVLRLISHAFFLCLSVI